MPLSGNVFIFFYNTAATSSLNPDPSLFSTCLVTTGCINLTSALGPYTETTSTLINTLAGLRPDVNTCVNNGARTVML